MPGSLASLSDHISVLKLNHQRRADFCSAIVVDRNLIVDRYLIRASQSRHRRCAFARRAIDWGPGQKSLAAVAALAFANYVEF
jgi:hypothetical protein